MGTVGRWRLGQKRRAAGHKQQHVINHRLPVVATNWAKDFLHAGHALNCFKISYAHDYEYNYGQCMSSNV